MFSLAFVKKFKKLATDMQKLKIKYWKDLKNLIIIWKVFKQSKFSLRARVHKPNKGNCHFDSLIHQRQTNST